MHQLRLHPSWWKCRKLTGLTSRPCRLRLSESTTDCNQGLRGDTMKRVVGANLVLFLLWMQHTTRKHIWGLLRQQSRRRFRGIFVSSGEWVLCRSSCPWPSRACATLSPALCCCLSQHPNFISNCVKFEGCHSSVKVNFNTFLKVQHFILSSSVGVGLVGVILTRLTPTALILSRVVIIQEVRKSLNLFFTKLPTFLRSDSFTLYLKLKLVREFVCGNATQEKYPHVFNANTSVSWFTSKIEFRNHPPAANSHHPLRPNSPLVQLIHKNDWITVNNLLYLLVKVRHEQVMPPDFTTTPPRLCPGPGRFVFFSVCFWFDVFCTVLVYICRL